MPDENVNASQWTASLSDFWLNGRGLDAGKNNGGAGCSLALGQSMLKSEDDDVQAYAYTAVLGAVARVIDIVHGKNKFTVDFTSKHNRTDFAQKNIALSSGPLVNAPCGFTLADSVDVLTGMALHEAAHAQFSDPEFYTEIPGNKFMAVVRNVVEDVYLENLTSLYYPGYRGYFWKARRYEFDLDPAQAVPPQGAHRLDTELNLRAHEFVRILRSTKNFKSGIPRVNMAAGLVIKALSADRPETLRRVNTRSLSLRVYRELFGTLIDEDIAYVGLSDMLDKYNRSGHYDASQPTGDERPDVKVPISDTMDQLIQNLRQEQMQVANMGELMEAGLENIIPPPPMVLFRRPVFDEAARERYAKSRAAVMAYVIKLRNRLSWGNTRQVMHQYQLPSGELDEDSLYQAYFSNRLFYRTEIIETRTRKLDVALLVDSSASMTQRVNQEITRLELARNLAALFLEALEPLKSVETWVFGFARKMAVHLTELYSPGLPVKERLGALSADGTTPEGTALKYCAARLFAEGRRWVPKVLIVITDGNPDPGPEKALVPEQVRRLRGMGCILIHLSISQRSANYGYDHSIPWSDYDTVISQFGKLLKRLVEGDRVS